MEEFEYIDRHNTSKENTNDNFGIHRVVVKNKTFDGSKEIIDSFLKDKITFKNKKKLKSKKDYYNVIVIPKNKFIPKTFKKKKVDNYITIIYGTLKEENKSLSGSGFFDFIKSPLQTIRNLFSRNLTKLSNHSRDTLASYGNIPIVQIEVIRSPVERIINTLVNFISLGKWNELKAKYGYDKLFHLGIVFTLSTGQKIIMEKIDIVSISPNISTNKDTEYLNIPINKEYILNKIVDDTQKLMGLDRFYDYNAFTENCQIFCKSILLSQQLYSKEADKFIFQDLSNIQNELPQYVPKIMKGVTDTANVVAKLIGRGFNTNEIEFYSYLLDNNHKIDNIEDLKKLYDKYMQE
jgi:hypothetical protein